MKQKAKITFTKPQMTALTLAYAEQEHQLLDEDDESRKTEMQVELMNLEHAYKKISKHSNYK